MNLKVINNWIMHLLNDGKKAEWKMLQADTQLIPWLWKAVWHSTESAITHLTLILLKWRLWWAPNNACKWQMGFNLAFKGLKLIEVIPLLIPTWYTIFYINYIKLNSSTCFEHHPLIFRRSMMLIVHVCSLWYSHSLQVAILCTC